METPAVLRKCQYAFLTLANYSLIAVSNALEPLRMANRLVGKDVYEWSVVSRLIFPARIMYARESPTCAIVAWSLRKIVVSSVVDMRPLFRDSR